MPEHGNDKQNLMERDARLSQRHEAECDVMNQSLDLSLLHEKEILEATRSITIPIYRRDSKVNGIL